MAKIKNLSDLAETISNFFLGGILLLMAVSTALQIGSGNATTSAAIVKIGALVMIGLWILLFKKRISLPGLMLTTIGEIGLWLMMFMAVAWSGDIYLFLLPVSLFVLISIAPLWRRQGL